MPAYDTINGELAKPDPSRITSYNEWHTAVISGISVSSGDKVTAGIHVECAGAGNGAWGKIDDALFNYDD
jgi:arabinogalactan endo-1,4-beta-galactosidase